MAICMRCGDSYLVLPHGHGSKFCSADCGQDYRRNRGAYGRSSARAFTLPPIEIRGGLPFACAVTSLIVRPDRVEFYYE